MVSKAIFITALFLSSLLGTTNVQSDAKQDFSTTRHELVTILPAGGGFTDLVITREALTLTSYKDCYIVGVTLSSSNGISYTDSFSSQEQYSIPANEVKAPGDYILSVIGTDDCLDEHQFTVH